MRTLMRTAHSFIDNDLLLVQRKNMFRLVSFVHKSYRSGYFLRLSLPSNNRFLLKSNYGTEDTSRIVGKRDRELSLRLDAKTARFEDTEQTELDLHNPWEAAVDNTISEVHDILQMSHDTLSPTATRNIALWFLGDSLNELNVLLSQSGECVSDTALKNLIAWKKGVLDI